MVGPTLKRIALSPPELAGAITSTGYKVLRCEKAKAEPRVSLFVSDYRSLWLDEERNANYRSFRRNDLKYIATEKRK